MLTPGLRVLLLILIVVIAEHEGVEVITVVGDEGSDVILPCSPSTKENLETTPIDWKKGDQEVFFCESNYHYNNGRHGQDKHFKGRVLYYQDELKNGNASIKIQNAKVSDSGLYTCTFPHLQPRQVFHVELVIRADVVKVSVREGDTAVLPCSISTKENIVAAVFDWIKDSSPSRKEVFFYESGLHYNNGRPGQDVQFKGRVSHFQDELKNGNASIKIQNTKIEDSGNYTCIFPKQPRQISYVQLLVGASPELYFRILNVTKDGSLLQCEVRGAFPKPEVEWQDSAGNILSAEEPQVSEIKGRFHVTLNITVTRSDTYRCLVTQKEIRHQTHFETYIFVSEKQCEDKVNSGWLVATLVLGAVLTLVFVVELGLVATNRLTITFNKDAARGPFCKIPEESHRLNSRQENKDSHQQTNGHGTHLEEEPV